MKSSSLTIMLTNVTKSYNHHLAIKDINVTFQEGYLHMITGANGSGKSTILKCIMGMLHYEGRIQKDHVKIGYAPEHFIMPEYMTVYDFLYSIGRIKSNSVVKTKETLELMLSMFELELYQSLPISKLSNGMKQKVNLIQAIIHQPKILLLDEPTNAIDEASIKKFIPYLKELSKSTLIIISTHQPELFIGRNKKIYRLEAGRLI